MILPCDFCVKDDLSICRDFCEDKLLKFLWRIALIMFELQDLVVILYGPLDIQHLLKLPPSLQQLISERTLLFAEQPHFVCMTGSSDFHLLKWTDQELDKIKFWRDLRYILHGHHAVRPSKDMGTHSLTETGGIVSGRHASLNEIQVICAGKQGHYTRSLSSPA